MPGFRLQAPLTVRPSAVLLTFGDIASASGGGPTEAPLPGGAASLSVAWDDMAGESGYVVYLSTSSQLFGDPGLYAYRYLAAANATSRTVTSIAAGTYYVRVAGYEGSVVGELSHEITVTAA